VERAGVLEIDEGRIALLILGRSTNSLWTTSRSPSPDESESPVQQAHAARSRKGARAHGCVLQ